MSWLVSEARVLASVETATSRAERRRGLLGRSGIEGAYLIEPCRWVHTLGMQFPIDIAFLDSDGMVVRTVQMPRRRVGLPVLRARSVIEAEAGAFARWGLCVGDTIELRTDSPDQTT